MAGSTETDRAYIQQNDASRERLRALVQRLSDERLSRPMPAGWTVAAVLAHIGFWDARASFLVDKLGRGGLTPDDDEPDDVDWVNDAGKPLCLALPPRTAADLALRLAEEADAAVAGLSDARLATVRAEGQRALTEDRAGHRNEHLDDIERVLKE